MSGRRAAAASSPTGVAGRVRGVATAPLALLRLLGPTQLAIAAVLLGVVLAMVGLGLRWSASDEATRTVRLEARTAVSVLPGRLSPGSAVSVQAHADAGATTVFVGVARDDDARAYLDSSGWLEQTGPDDDATTRHAGTAALSDPRLSDVWVSFAATPGEASLAWPSTAGTWRIVAAAVASPGAAPAPLTVDLSWSGNAAARGGGWWISGLVLGGLGLIALVVLRLLGRSAIPAAMSSTSARVRARSAPPAQASHPGQAVPTPGDRPVRQDPGDPDQTTMIPMRGMPAGVSQAPPYVSPEPAARPVTPSAPGTAQTGVQPGVQPSVQPSVQPAAQADDESDDEPDDEPPVLPFRRSPS